MNTAIRQVFDEDDDAMDAMTSLRPSASSNRALLDAMMRQIQSELRSLAPTEIAVIPPWTVPQVRPANPFLSPWKPGDPPVPWTRKPAVVTTVRVRKPSSMLRIFSFALFGIACGIGLGAFMQPDRATAIVGEARSVLARADVNAIATLAPTTAVTTTTTRDYVPFAKASSDLRRSARTR